MHPLLLITPRASCRVLCFFFSPPGGGQLQPAPGNRCPHSGDNTRPKARHISWLTITQAPRRCPPSLLPRPLISKLGRNNKHWVVRNTPICPHPLGGSPPPRAPSRRPPQGNLATNRVERANIRQHTARSRAPPGKSPATPKKSYTPVNENTP